MPRPRRKPLWRWEPLPYLVVVLFLLITGSLRPDATPVAFWIFFVVTVVVVLAFAALLIAEWRRPTPNPDSSGNLATLHGLTVVDAASTADRHVPVADVGRHQAAVDAAQARAASTGESLTAVLVPGASRWLAVRLRVSVQLVTQQRIHHGGFLPDGAADRWQVDLERLRAGGVYVRVPASIVGVRRPYALELDLGGLADAVHSAGAQHSPS